MPIKLEAPRAGLSKNWRIRGTYLGVRVDQTTGAPDKKIAAKVLAKVRDEIEDGAFSRPGAPTFAGAALKYVEAGGEERFVLRLAEHFGETPLTRIDQAAVDAAALALYPRATPATRNRQVYSPVSAILKVAGVADGLKRPKGARGARRLFWLTPEQASALLTAAEARDAEFGLFLAFLLYTGCRLTEALSLQIAGVNLSEGWARDSRQRTASRALCICRPSSSPRWRRTREDWSESERFSGLARMAGFTLGWTTQRAPQALRSRRAWRSMPFGTHGARGCAAMGAWTRRALSKPARGDRGRPPPSMSTPSRAPRRARRIYCRMFGGVERSRAVHHKGSKNDNGRL